MLCGKGLNRFRSRCLTSLTKLDKVIFLKSFDYVILGLDGYATNFLEDYQGLECVIKRLDDHCKKVCLATNDTFRTGDEQLEFFYNKGLCEMEEIDIMNPVKAIIHYCKHHVQEGSIVSLCSEKVNSQLIANGLKIVTPITEREEQLCPIKEFFTPDFVPSAVLVDINFNLHISHLTFAIECLKRFPDCKILTTQVQKTIDIKKDYQIISPFGFVNALRKCTTKEPILLGKRGKYFHCLICYRFKLGKPCRTLFIGENLETDIQFGIESGFQTILLTDNEEMIESLMTSDIKPNFYIRSLTQLASVVSVGAKHDLK